MNARAIVLKDGNRGHEKQLDAFISFFPDSFFTNIQELRIRKLNLQSVFREVKLTKRMSGNETWVIGAGHKTHLLILFLKQVFNWKGIVIMKPTLPISLFDLCIAPEHDQIKPRENLILSKGPLVTLSKSTQKK